MGSDALSARPAGRVPPPAEPGSRAPSGRTSLAGRLRAAWERHRADLAAVGLLWGLCLLFLWRLFSPIAAYRLHVVQGDFTNQFYPFRYFAAAEWRAGRVPLWNPYVFAGHPFLGDVQTAVFYPPSLANALLGALFGLPLSALELEMAAHYPLAALFTYLLGRRLLGSRLGAAVAAVVFTFGGFLTSYPAQQLAMLESAVWLPLVLLCLDLAATRPSSGYRWHVAAGLAFGVAILAGHPQTAMFVGYTSLAYLVYPALRGVAPRTLAGAPKGARPTDFAPVRRAIAGAAVFLVVGLGLAAVEVLPAAEFLGLSTRASLPYEAAAYGYDRRALLGVLLPGWRDEKALYVGVLPLLLAALAIGRRVLPRSWWGDEPGDDAADACPTLFLAGVALLAVALSVGGKTPLFPVVYRLVPGFTLFRDQERIVYLFAFSASLLAGSGASYLARLTAAQARRVWPLWRGLAGALALALAGSAALLLLGRRYPATFNPSGSLTGSVAFFVAMALAGAAAVYLGRLTDPGGRGVHVGATLRSAGSPRLFGAVLLGVVVADLFAVNLGNNLSPADPDPGPRFAGIVEALRPTPEDFRVRGENDEAFPPNYAAVWGLPTINGDTPFGLQRVADFLYAENAEWRRWQVLNVKYYVGKGPGFEGIELALESGDLKVYRVVYSLPRAWAVRDAQVAESPADALRRVLAPKYHPGDTVILEEPPGIGPFVKGERPDVRITSYTPQRVEIAARGDGNAMVVLGDTYYPGWQALLDGRPAKLYRANYVVRAVELPPGEHRIELVYDPISFKAGALVSGLVAIGGVLALAWPRRRAEVGKSDRPHDG